MTGRGTCPVCRARVGEDENGRWWHRAPDGQAAGRACFEDGAAGGVYPPRTWHTSDMECAHAPSMACRLPSSDGSVFIYYLEGERLTQGVYVGKTVSPRKRLATHAAGPYGDLARMFLIGFGHAAMEDHIIEMLWRGPALLRNQDVRGWRSRPSCYLVFHFLPGAIPRLITRHVLSHDDVSLPVGQSAVAVAGVGGVP